MLALNPYKVGILQLCERYGVAKLYLFGSALSDRFDARTSDVDVLVEMQHKANPLDLGESLIHLWDSLEGLFGRKVDLLTPSGLKNPFLKDEVERTKKLVYDDSSVEKMQ